ncbi:MAG: type II toxin-antitoxin system VapC family toxin [Spirochaetales bacterium]
MVVDTSALIAILEDEAERPLFTRAIASAPVVRVSAASFLEAGIVLETRRGPAAVHALDALAVRSGLKVEEVTEEIARVALRAFRQFGKGRHAAGLNYGDLFSYALASVRGEPLLFKGDDFGRTDVIPAP